MLLPATGLGFAAVAGANYGEADYKVQLKKLVDTQVVIDSVVGYVVRVDHKDFPDLISVMDGTVDQPGKIKDARAKADEVVGNKASMPDDPKIAGPNAEYIERQRFDIQSGARANGNAAAMQGVVHLLRDEEIKALANHISKLKP